VSSLLKELHMRVSPAVTGATTCFRDVAAELTLEHAVV